MSEAAAEETVVEKEITEVAEQPEYSAEEQEALDAGWNPEGEDKDGKTLDAKEYMARKPLFNKIHNLRDEQSQMKGQLSELRKDMTKMTQSFIKEKETLVTQLKAQRDVALDNLETDKVKELDKQIEVVGAATQEQATGAVYDKQAWGSAYTTFLKENAWYGTDQGLTKAADFAAESYADGKENIAPDDLYNHVMTKIKNDFPDRFAAKGDQQKQAKVSTSSRRSTSSVKKSAVKLSDLDSESQKVVQVMASATGKTIEEYLKNYEV